MSTQTGHFYTPSRILRMAELTRLLGISRSTIYEKMNPASKYYDATFGNDSNLLIVFYVQIMPDDFVMQLHRF